MYISEHRQEGDSVTGVGSKRDFRHVSNANSSRVLYPVYLANTVAHVNTKRGMVSVRSAAQQHPTFRGV